MRGGKEPSWPVIILLCCLGPFGILMAVIWIMTADGR